MFDLRDYQVKPVDVGVTYFLSGSKEPSIIVAPTAFGKSLLVAYIAKTLKQGVLVLQPSKELLEQNYSKVTALGVEASIYSASFNTKEFGHITYATIGSIKDMGRTFKEKGYKYLIIDELHLYPRSSTSMLGNFMKTMGIKSVLGLTATPFKLQNYTDMEDGGTYSQLVMLTTRNKHGQFYKKILHVTQIKEMLDRNYWAKLKYEEHDFSTKDLQYNSTKAEYTDESVIAAYENQEIGSKVVNRIADLEDSRKSILVFVPSISEAIDLSSKVPNSAAVYSDMPKKEREEVIRKFRAKEIKAVFNVNILSVGFDYPEIDCIIMARPTASLAWFYQAAGRGTRPFPTKEDCLIIDFVGNVGKFGKIEELYFKYQEGEWKLYGSGGKLLTGIPIHKIGLYFDPDVVPPRYKEPILHFGKFSGKNAVSKEVPDWYKKWLLTDFKFSPEDIHIRRELQKYFDNKLLPQAKSLEPSGPPKLKTISANPDIRNIYSDMGGGIKGKKKEHPFIKRRKEDDQENKLPF
jgi:DNA repair protein RadD